MKIDEKVVYIILIIAIASIILNILLINNIIDINNSLPDKIFLSTDDFKCANCEDIDWGILDVGNYRLVFQYKNDKLSLDQLFLIKQDTGYCRYLIYYGKPLTYR